jgi:hypothetical protein
MTINPPPAVDDWHAAAWMQTFTGRAFRPFAATIEDIDAADIARSLAMTCRYNGHVNRFYSVAEHSIHMAEHFARVGDRETALWALLHDAAEAYIGDMVRPLKVTDSMAPFRALDHQLTALIATKFGLIDDPAEFHGLPAAVKDADARILLTERDALLSTPPQPWGQDGMEPLDVDVRCWSPTGAETAFLTALDELDGGRW